ncbi:MAG: NADH:ubiquinone reductase (Na(+)-transporting) subunit C [Kiritimatiellae bacterium]|nr:NADH:ubiquinone reductase (Na(+)-transporting) subunit C [Kiritimatiellia bacterium]
MRDQAKIIGFATAVCLVCSILLALVSTALGPRQARNKANDVKSKVLQVFGVQVTDASGKPCVSPEELDTLFKQRITGLVLDSTGKHLPEKAVADLNPREISEPDKTSGLKPFYPLYIYEDPETQTRQYAIHVSGKGLWSTVKGFMALKADQSTIAGIVFYEHQETPGLGGEIEKPFFLNRFKGKQLHADGTLQAFRITKPGAQTDMHSVDGITAATMTCRGVENFLNTDFAVYDQYFKNQKAVN